MKPWIAEKKKSAGIDWQEKGYGDTCECGDRWWLVKQQRVAFCINESIQHLNIIYAMALCNEHKTSKREKINAS